MNCVSKAQKHNHSLDDCDRFKQRSVFGIGWRGTVSRPVRGRWVRRLATCMQKSTCSTIYDYLNTMLEMLTRVCMARVDTRMSVLNKQVSNLL